MFLTETILLNKSEDTILAEECERYIVENRKLTESGYDHCYIITKCRTKKMQFLTFKHTDAVGIVEIRITGTKHPNPHPWLPDSRQTTQVSKDFSPDDECRDNLAYGKNIYGNDTKSVDQNTLSKLVDCKMDAVVSIEKPGYFVIDLVDLVEIEKIHLYATLS